VDLRLEGVSKRFGDVLAVDRLDLTIEEGEFFTLLGPSGCGKTTILRIVAGFETPDTGRVVFDADDITDRSPQRRGFGMVFQNYALFPHLSVFENVAFGLRARRLPADQLRERVARALALVHLDRFGDRRVQQLSGGQQQRIALARALAIEPPLLLLDEPLSNLDATLRERTRTELRLLLKEIGITALFVTHDQEEAFDLSDRVAVLREGRLRQVGTPHELYKRPADRFVAGFVGKATLLTGLLEQHEADVLVRLDSGAAWRACETAGQAIGQRVEVVVRPEELELSRVPDSASDLTGKVIDVRYLGSFTSYRVELPDGQLIEVAAPAGRADEGEEVGLHPTPDTRLHALPLREP
jgi:iron(III) transport system ATP-binding protein